MAADDRDALLDRRAIRTGLAHDVVRGCDHFEKPTSRCRSGPRFELAGTPGGLALDLDGRGRIAATHVLRLFKVQNRGLACGRGIAAGDSSALCVVTGALIAVTTTIGRFVSDPSRLAETSNDPAAVINGAVALIAACCWCSSSWRSTSSRAMVATGYGRARS